MNALGKNIAYYRKEKGLSQEKLAEYMGTSRQAVTKWENGKSKPSTENLIKLSELFCIEIEDLLLKEMETPQRMQSEISMGKGPQIWCLLSTICAIIYILHGTLNNSLHIATLICIVIIAFPVQLFSNLYLTNAINNNDFNNIAGFDPHITYNTREIKKLLISINQHIGVCSTFYIFLVCIADYVNISISLLIILYSIEIVITILFLNYRAIEKIYCNEKDIWQAKISWPITVSYLALLLAGLMIFLITFYMKGIENNTTPALILILLLSMSIMIASIGYFKESNTLKNRTSSDGKYTTIGFYRICYIIAILFFIAMLFVGK